MRTPRRWLATRPARLHLLYTLGSDRATKAICYSDCGVMPWGTCHGHKRVGYRRAEGR